MSWVYPVAASNIQEWYDVPSGYGHAAALAVGDSEYIYAPAGIYRNSILLDMGQDCGLCEIRARRGTGLFDIASLVVHFHDAGFSQSEQWLIDLQSYPNWSDFTFTPSFPWRYVDLEGHSIDVLVGVSMLRGASIVNIPRRLLTGVGL
ncbi:MAG: hypothetical protein CFK49_09700 [Armatimonadetes bacterium JP3_11]|nr:MAG: hypothetical protein CFK49_09700 [Armatimonadetes bacterium JP3_11]